MSLPNLSLQDKYAIQGMLHQEKTVEEIHEVMQDKDMEDIQEYVDFELERIHEVVAEQDLDEVEKFIDTQIYSRVKGQLVKGGVHEQDADRLLKKALDECATLPDEPTLYRLALKNIKSGQYIAKSGRHKPEAAVMTKVASERSDMARDNYPAPISRTARNAVYRPNSGKIE